MDDRRKFGLFTVLPATIAAGPVIAPVMARLDPKTPEWLPTDNFLLEVADSLFLWAIMCPLYLMYALSQPDADVSKESKRRLAWGMGALAVAGVAQFAFSFAGLPLR